MTALWRERRCIFQAAGQHGWMNSHAQVPTAWRRDAHTLRVFFATRRVPGQSLMTFIDVGIDDPSRVLYLHDQPVLPLGCDAAFDAHGVMPSSIVGDDRGGLRLYYSGWCRDSGLPGVPYTNLTGLALSDDGVRFSKVGEAPVLVRTDREPYSATSPCVRRVGDTWWMWYCSGTAWKTVNGQLEHQYDIKIATSADGVHWTQDGRVALACGSDEALTRPSVCEIDGQWHMWFCHRRMGEFRDGPGSYRIAHATSPDMLHWKRSDDAAFGLDVSTQGWDSTMVAYPEVVRIGDRLLMFYNGNGFGQGGLGVAWCAIDDLRCAV